MKDKIYNMVMFRNINSPQTIHEQFSSVGLNTGNMIFTKSLERNMRVDIMPYCDFISNLKVNDYYDAIITTDMIWITPTGDFSFLIKQLEEIDKPFIPISIGVQNRLDNIKYTLNDSALRALNLMQERATLGVRGEITADILEKNGIKNIDIIGCPSLYYWNHPEFKIEKAEKIPKRIVYNFRTFYGKLSKDEAHFLSYCAQRKYDFVEQTEAELVSEMCPSTKYYDYVGTRIYENKHIFFDADKWRRFISDYDFSIGSRFHGNVVSLWNMKPALFIVIDSRMKEMIDYFELPYIYMRDFDDTKPIEFYYNQADYTQFNNCYKKKFYHYIDFLKKNKIL